MMEERGKYNAPRRFRVYDVVLIDGSRNENLKYYDRCWGQIVSASTKHCTIAVGTDVFNSVSASDLRLIENADKDKAKDILEIIFQFKNCQNILIGDLQFLIRPAISKLDTIIS